MRPDCLRLVLGDQLWRDNPALKDFDPARDLALMIEAPGEATVVWSHQARIALFLSAMRHFRDELTAAGLPVHYVATDDEAPPGFDARLRQVIEAVRPKRLTVCEPGEWRTRQLIERVAGDSGVPLTFCVDTHFMTPLADFERWAAGRRSLRLEHFYREQRRRHQVLMADGEPLRRRWNFDKENRRHFEAAGPRDVPTPPHFAPDAITREVLALVARRYASHPGSLADFGWPVTAAQASQMLEAFIATRLSGFGPHQDAMWTGQPWLWHALLSTSLNLHLLDPRTVVAAAVRAFHDGRAELQSVEGFVRQVLGWREFIRGVYWTMPALRAANHYAHTRPLPSWYWTAETQMVCMREVVGQVLRHGYAHHIQRLMVTGQFALLAGVLPQAVEDWYLAMFVDAVEWVELPNTAGMALHADGGSFTSKPYIASGQYIKRMSNYCRGCRYEPAQRTGPRACPVTVLYWGFLDREEARLAANPRTLLMAKSIGRLPGDARAAIRAETTRILANLDSL